MKKKKEAYYRYPKSLVKVSSKILSVSGIKLIVILRDFEEGGKMCFAGNKWLSKNLNVDLKQLKKTLSKLEKLGILKREYKEGKRYLFITKDYDFSKLSSPKFTRANEGGVTPNKKRCDATLDRGVSHLKKKGVTPPHNNTMYTTLGVSTLVKEYFFTKNIGASKNEAPERNADADFFSAKKFTRINQNQNLLGQNKKFTRINQNQNLLGQNKKFTRINQNQNLPGPKTTPLPKKENPPAENRTTIPDVIEIQKFVSSLSDPKTPKEKLLALKQGKGFSFGISEKDKKTISVLDDRPFIEILNLWNDFPGVQKHKLGRTKTILKSQRYFHRLTKGELYSQVKFNPEYLNKHQITHSLLTKQFLSAEIIQMFKRAKNYYVLGFEPENKKMLPRNLDGFFLWLPAAYNKLPYPVSWFLQTCAHKPLSLEEMPDTIRSKYAEIEELFSDMVKIYERTDRIAFNRTIDKLKAFHEEIFYWVYQIDNPSQVKEIERKSYHPDVNSYGYDFWTFESMIGLYHAWLSEPRQSWIPKNNIYRLFSPKGQFFLRFIDFTARANYRESIIPDRDYDEYGDDNYYYNRNDRY